MFVFLNNIKVSSSISLNFFFWSAGFCSQVCQCHTYKPHLADILTSETMIEMLMIDDEDSEDNDVSDELGGEK